MRKNVHVTYSTTVYQQNDGENFVKNGSIVYILDQLNNFHKQK